jgi:hypothetical protein
LADHGTILVRLEDIIRSIGAGDSAEAITSIDSVLRDDIDPLCAQPDADLFQRALKLRDELIAVRVGIFRNTGEALGVAYGALANWTRGKQS